MRQLSTAFLSLREITPVNTTAIVPDLAHFPLVNQLFAEFFPTAPPARMTINAPLPKGLQFSIGCVAALAD